MKNKFTKQTQIKIIEWCERNKVYWWYDNEMFFKHNKTIVRFDLEKCILHHNKNKIVVKYKNHLLKHLSNIFNIRQSRLVKHAKTSV